MEKPIISVLVPVYNVENTLDRCMQSILKQTFQNFEVLLIDDGSTDGSGLLCDKYALEYSNIRVIHKENEGLGPTRNRGIKEAQGEYVYHCDSDDWIKENLLQEAYDTITKTNADMVVFGYEIYTKKDNELSLFQNIALETKVLNHTQQIREIFVENYFKSFVMMSACNRLYRKQFLIDNNLFFPPLRRCQDMAYSFLLFDKISKIAFMQESYYCYIIEPGVYKGRAYNEMLDIYKYIYTAAQETFKKWNIYDMNIKNSLVGYICEHIANYSMYAIFEKYKKEWKQTIKVLLQDKEVLEIFKQYPHIKKSKFMRLFCWGIKVKSPWFLRILASFKHKWGKRTK